MLDTLTASSERRTPLLPSSDGTSERPPALVLRSDRIASVTVIRSLGREGIRVVGAAPSPGPGQFSRHLAAHRRIAAGLEPTLAWLRKVGQARPGRVLLPCEDATVWLLREHGEELAQWFRFAPIHEPLLDKVRLHEACAEVGLATPATRALLPGEPLPEIPADCFPLYVKRCSQVGAGPQFKGQLVERPDGMALAIRRAAMRAPGTARAHPAVLIQEYIAPAAGQNRALTGFISADGTVRGLRASRKSLQQPVAGGLGVCFEEDSVDPDFAERIVKLLRMVSFAGPFEVEFLMRDGVPFVIDFNPRFAKQVAFDVARGLDLPAMAYAEALGDRAWLERLAARAEKTAAPRGLAFCDVPALKLMLRTGPSAGELTAAEVRGWQAWLREHRGRIVEPVLSWSDPLPGMARTIGNLPKFGRVLAGSFRNTKV